MTEATTNRIIEFTRHINPYELREEIEEEVLNTPLSAIIAGLEAVAQDEEQDEATSKEAEDILQEMNGKGKEENTMKNYKIFGDTKTSLKLNARAEQAYSNSEYTIAEYEKDGQTLYDIYGSDNLSDCNLISEGMTADEVNDMLEQQFLESLKDSIDYIVQENREEIRDLQGEAEKQSLLHPGCVYMVIANYKTGEVYRTYSGEDRWLESGEVLLAYYKDSSLSGLDDYAWSDYGYGVDSCMKLMTPAQKEAFEANQKNEDGWPDHLFIRDELPDVWERYMNDCADECVSNSVEEGDYDEEVYDSVQDWKNSLY